MTMELQSMLAKEQYRVHVRWMIRRDMPDVVAIEELSFDAGRWCEDDFLACLRQRNAIGMVAEHGDVITGFMIYELSKSSLTTIAEAMELRRIITPAFAPRKLPPKPASAPRPVITPRSVPAEPRPHAIAAVAEGEFQPSKVQKRILDAIAWYESLGNMEPSTTQIGAVALIDPTGGYFSNSVGPLVTNGLIERGAGTVRLTDAGRAIATPIEDVGTLADYHEVLRQRIRKMKSASGKTIEILNAIINAGGQGLTTQEIGSIVGVDPTGGYFSNSIGPLSTAGVIERRHGMVTPTEVLFPAGLG